MNAPLQYRTTVDGVEPHYVHEEGSSLGAPPLLICHGRPYSSLSYARMVVPLTHPQRHGGRVEDAFSVVIPSMPGYAFSGRPLEPMGPLAVAGLFDGLMGRPGYDRYLVHGGDWGAQVASLLGFHRPERVAGVHAPSSCARAGAARRAFARKGRARSSTYRRP